MKPIHLKLSGLQSYREEQQIDFQSLCESGLFGIFGPTGSGKSTILDAITLALYGKIERATNGTQGIMNQAENQLMVSFAFQLSSAEETKTFRVERRFKRANEISVSNTVSRFVEVTADGEVVLADKLADVTRLVEYHIGLKMDDFTRAVVLPQGKFAEFLSLKGSERRQMLQRLFSLERYGDELAAKLARSVKETEGEVRTSLAEQQGLGDASVEAVERAEATLQDAAMIAEAAKAERQEAEERYQSWSELRKLQAERDQLHERQKQGEREAERIAQEQQRLQRALDAEQLMPAIDEAARASAEHARSTETLREAEQQANAAQTAREAAEQANNAAKSAREQQEPELLQRIDQLKQAVKVNLEVERLTTELVDNDAQGRIAADKAAHAQAEMNRMNELLQRASARQQELKQQMRELDCPTAVRERLQEARLAKTTLAEAERRFVELDHHMAQAKRQLEGSEEALRAQAVHLGAWSERLPNWLSTVSELHYELLASKQEAEQLTAQTRSQLEQTRTEARNASKAALAAELASTLITGESCPVCGSKEHDSIPHNIEEQQVIYREAEQQVEQCEHRMEQLRMTMTEIESAIDRCRSMKDELRERLGDAGKRAASWLPTLGGAATESAIAVQAETWFNDSTEEADYQRSDKDFSQSGVVEIRQAVQHALARTEQLGTDKDQLLRSVEELLWNLQQAVVDVNNAKQLHNEASVQHTAGKQLVDEQRQSWQIAYPDWEPASIEQLWQQRQEADRTLEDSRQRYEKSISYIEDMEAQQKQQQQLHREAELNAVQCTTSREGLLRMKAQYDEQLAPWLEAGPIPVQLTQAEQQLTGIRQHEEHAQNQAEAARRREAEAAQHLALSKQAASNAELRHREAKSQVEAKLLQSGFSTQAEVIACRLSEAERQIIEKMIAAFEEEQSTLRIRLMRIAEQLQGKEIGDAEWSECQLQWQAARERDEAAFAQRVKAERDVEQLRVKHARWMELESLMSSGRERLSRLQQLQSVFRGNAFVEFVAEEQLMQVSRAASERLKLLTKQRYALEVDSGGGFVIRDDANGGIRRPVSTLSGGETFLTSLALALALSAQIQLRGMYPLQFFFLDEGFGTLDPELLDTVITALEKLHHDKLSVGVISHVPELRARLPRKIVVTQAEQAGRGSRIALETL